MGLKFWKRKTLTIIWFWRPKLMWRKTRRFDYLNVNEILELIRNTYGNQYHYIESIEVASLNNQRNPQKMVVGVGGVLNIICKKTAIKEK